MPVPKFSRCTLRCLGRALRRPLYLLGMRIGLPMRERIALHVSAINRCVVCSAVHGVVGRMAGLSNDEISAAGAEVEPGLDRRTRTALRYAELRTTNREDAYPEDVESFERLFEKAEREEVEAVVDFLTFFNHLNNTWESLLPGAEARRACRHPQPSGHSWHKSI